MLARRCINLFAIAPSLLASWPIRAEPAVWTQPAAKGPRLEGAGAVRSARPAAGSRRVAKTAGVHALSRSYARLCGLTNERDRFER